MLVATIISLLILGYLLVLSIIDIRKHELPSFYTTTAIVILAGVNIATSPAGLNYGILAFVIGWLFLEIDLFAGLADVKALTILGLLMADLPTFIIMIFLVSFFNLVYQVVLMKFFNKKSKDDIPFLPVYFLTYLAIFLIGIF